ncbi:NAD(P)/FAD-dependent oxidoreductase [Nibricoccus sp. IMCC34717]|uniref:NAD(P)/FAD-dependent oxidoreductase n=1 Tax=Nibricoccus sp. IMCC34717 TaxID=3034021 RepID=UPI003850B22C
MSFSHALVIGGGAAGFFGAITCAEAHPGRSVRLLEGGPQVLTKVRISGGGRCNVTHACWEPRELVKRYPRGSRELLGAFSRWQPRDTVDWFTARGVPLHTEEDGRMFPNSNVSATVVDCLERSARAAGVQVQLQASVKRIEVHPASPRFSVHLSDGATLTCDRLLVATGGSKAAHPLLAALGHTIEPPVPSLFTFNITDPRLADIAGVSVPLVTTQVVGTKLREQGPVLVTHWGLSGPGILKLSAWGARELAEVQYRFTLRVNWLGTLNADQARERLAAERTTHAKRQVATSNPFGLPGRLWEKLLTHAGLAHDAQWAGVGNAALGKLLTALCASDFAVDGKSTNKEEFVTCGGVRLGEVDFRTMESRLIPGLHLAGEVLDIDGITGGFNFQAAWTTGHIAGRSMT